MGFWKSFFGGKAEDPEEKRRSEEARNFDVLKYDGVRALQTHQAGYAIECFRHALALQEDLEVRDYLSQAFIQTGQLPQAYDELQKLAEAQPDNQALFLRMAHVAYMMEDYGAMGSACERAMLISQDNPEIYYMYARGCAGQDDLVNAEAMLTKALSLNADYAEAHLLRGEVRAKNGESGAADEDAAWLLERLPDSEDVLLLKAHVERSRGQLTEALGWYDKVIDANPFCMEAFRERMELRTRLGDTTGADDDRRKLSELMATSALAATDGGIEEKVKKAYDSINPLGL